MKTCKECAFYSENDGFVRVVQSCGAPDIPAVAKLVLGDVPGIEGAKIDCLHIRLNDHLCGTEGKWWKQKA